jgi:hypothetical protein
LRALQVPWQAPCLALSKPLSPIKNLRFLHYVACLSDIVEDYDEMPELTASGMISIMQRDGMIIGGSSAAIYGEFVDWLNEKKSQKQQDMSKQQNQQSTIA